MVLGRLKTSHVVHYFGLTMISTFCILDTLLVCFDRVVVTLACLLHIQLDLLESRTPFIGPVHSRYIAIATLQDQRSVGISARFQRLRNCFL